jgi:hypothetical protein
MFEFVPMLAFLEKVKTSPLDLVAEEAMGMR